MFQLEQKNSHLNVKLSFIHNENPLMNNIKPAKSVLSICLSQRLLETQQQHFSLLFSSLSLSFFAFDVPL